MPFKKHLDIIQEEIGEVMIICIVGPTGVGKTLLSVMLAKYYNGVVVNADACQIYRELNIGSAKVKEEEKDGVEHLLFDIKDASEEYSVADYQKDLRDILNKYQDRNIILVGGTGLYIKAGLFDYRFSAIRKKDYSKYSNEELYKKCLKRDKNLQIDQNNRRRLENYLNRIDKNTQKPILLYDVKFIGLTTERDNLYEIINKRVDKMFKEGLVQEVDDLLKKYGEVNILKRAIGYKEVIEYLKGKISLEECQELIKKNTRHYAKRQYTWFNNQMPVKWFNTNFNNFEETYNNIINYLKSN